VKTRSLLLAFLVLTIGAPAGIRAGRVSPQQQLTSGSFEQDVQPILNGVCSSCHNDRALSGGLSMSGLADLQSMTSQRDVWERILARTRAGEMPPPGATRPPADRMAAMTRFIETELDRLDKNARPDPGRVTAHRLNRAEYANTVRDLLGVNFAASSEFPADDSGYGFDNNGDVLTVSPALMQQYLDAAEKIAARAIGGDPLPAPGFFTRRTEARRLNDSVTELRATLAHDAGYTIRVSLTGHRGTNDKPVTLAISVDGQVIKTVSVPVQISAVNRQGGATQRGIEEASVFLSAGDHTFKAEFVNDTDLARIPANSRNDVNQNIFPEFVEVAGPFPPSDAQRAARKALLCDPASGPACIDRILTTVARRAYRRPATREDIAQLQRVVEKAKAAGYTPAQSLQHVIAAMLVSPHFLFRVERDPGPGNAAPITDIELASRLSYFLWSSMPDDELLALAEANTLHLPETLDAQIRRMIADPKSMALAENFAGQWLETRSLDAVKRDAAKFPEWTPALKDAMRMETQLFFHAALSDNRPVSDFINAPYTFLNDRLAAHYGIPGVEGSNFRKVELNGDRRSGVLTHASVLTVSSYPSRTSVVLRGKYILENILNAPPPPPPPNVPAINEAAVGVDLSLRGQMEQHRADPLCASCHTRMDPLGFAFENYDAIGRWRAEDGKFPIEAGGTLPNGKTFSGPAELKALLLDSLPEFTESLAERMLTYALGRGVEPSDRPVVRDLAKQTAADGYRFQTLVRAIARSAPFRERRGEDMTRGERIR
jgi:hypothetical protein